MSDQLRRVLHGLDASLRVAGALVGTLPVAVLLASALAAYLPLAADLRFAVALVLAIPLWVAGICTGFLAPRGWQLWLAIAVAVLVLALVTPAIS